MLTGNCEFLLFVDRAVRVHVYLERKNDRSYFFLRHTNDMTQNNKTYIDELSDITDSPGISDHQSEVCQYFKGRNVLITGASGFFGILLIEKLLR